MAAAVERTSAFDFDAYDLEGRQRSLGEYRGRVLLIVNVASRCSFTPQYAGLEALWRDYRDRGLVVLGFPCDQFRHQEPGDAVEIRSFCSSNYQVSFPLFAKVEVNGGRAHPLWVWLKSRKPGFLGTAAVKWNFSKFLVGRDGQVVSRHAPNRAPASLRGEIERALG
ncbi:glutathione peroxidase [Luteimonas sp. RD2P54]|uniref:Glutathione peroxidase n=1 Tax=Luteimonas endophytica TaxID=3042023 RepID=A0ABT6J8T2_9GAMM|nr:glutathione peroxidase [Luteimonas endophytica]MDH5823230.1 glutathione peroxidase [Luteimonas endophytica]